MKNITPDFFRVRPLLLPIYLLILAGAWSCAPIENSAVRLPAPTSSAPEITSKDEPKETHYDTAIELLLEENLVLESENEAGEADNVEEMTPPEPETTMVQEVEELEKLGSWNDRVSPPQTEEEKGVEYDFPITMNRQVEYYIDFFQNQNRKSFERWLSRSGRYIPMIQEQLREAGLPLDLVYLPMIESGYSLTAFSSAQAVGPWQFMRPTALNFGLEVTNYVDERRDPIKSTAAAIEYLKALYAEFNSWELAVAGYNAGEGRIRRGIEKHNTTDFWELAEKRFLPSETKLYVPKLIAAILIAKEPEKYGFSDVQLEDPLDFEYAQVPRWTSLRAVATALDTDFDEIYNLNRQLTKQITPPDQDIYNIKIPSGSKDLLASNLPRVYTTVTTNYKTHRVKQGETLDKICKKYNLNKTTILKANDLRNSKMQAGKMLRIPYRETQYVLLDKGQVKSPEMAQRSGDFILHKIKAGETVAKVAQRYKVTPKLIAAWNDLKDINRISAGQQLALYISDESEPALAASVNSEPLPKVSANKTAVPLLTGTSKRAVSKKASTASKTFYKVKGGDSLWEIAKRFNLEPKDIRSWNNLKGNTIHPGLELLLKI